MAETRILNREEELVDTEAKTAKSKTKKKTTTKKVKESAPKKTEFVMPKDIKGLVSELKKTRKALVLGENKDVSKLKKIRKEIARLLTLENQKNHE